MKAINTSGTPSRQDFIILELIFVVGGLVFGMVWWLERASGLITDWDRILLPSMAAITLLNGLLLWVRPQWHMTLKLVSTLTLNIYLVITLQSTLHFGEEAEAWYQFATGMHWLPLGYGAAFVFLNTRAALIVSGITIAGMFCPLTWLILTNQSPSWAPNFTSYVSVMALAQGMYVLMMLAVGQMRTNQHQAEQTAREMTHLARSDALTGLPNRRAMEAQVGALLANSRLAQRPLAVALIDIDHFKSVNDRFGHAAGDDVLREIGQVMRAELRGIDIVGRWGGEEFLLLAPEQSISAAAALVDRVRRAVSLHTFVHGETVTVSIGLAQALGDDDEARLMQRADQALYRAKEAGRNRVEMQVVGLA